jgi:hypothetical protein
MNIADHGYQVGLLCDLVDMALPSSLSTSASRAGFIAFAIVATLATFFSQSDLSR